MTLISATLNHGCPVLMADLLISSDEAENSINTPTFVNGTEKLFVNKSLKPVGLRQKLYIINDRLSIALGGRGDQMYTLLKRMKAFFANLTFSDDEFDDFIDNYPPEDKEHLIAITLKYNPTNETFNLRTVGRCTEKKNDRYEHVVALGSGAEQFVTFMDQNTKFTTDISGLDGMLVLNQYVISYWLGHEVASAQSLMSLWGAGFEMITFQSGKFVKLRDYTVVLFTGRIGYNHSFSPAPFSTMMCDYEQDLFVIRVFAHNERKVFIVPAIDEIRESVILDKFEPNHSTLLITYILENIDTSTQYFPTIVFPKNKNEFNESPVIIRLKDDGGLRMYTDPKTDEYIEKLVFTQIEEEALSKPKPTD